MSRKSLLLALPLLLAACSTGGTAALRSPTTSAASTSAVGASAAAAGSSTAASPARPSASATGAAPSSPTSSPAEAAAAPSVDKLTEQAFQEVGPAVVKITHPLPGGNGIALGSGTIIDHKGDILTNNHVAQGATSYQVTLANNRTVTGKLVGLDPLDDLAVIHIDVPNLPAVQLGDSSSLQVGQTVLAIGNPIGFTQTVTSGIVSALNRTVTEPADQTTGQAGSTIPNMIQISAPINPGNSGGALIDLNGRLVGVPTLAATDPELGGVAQGIAFAVPINKAKLIVPQLIAQGKVTHSGRAFLGVATQIVTPPLAKAYQLPVNHGAYVAQVAANSPAAKAGLTVGDIIVTLDGMSIQTNSDLADIILSHKPGDQLKITYYAGRQQKSATATLVEAPAGQG
ncbi:MAG: S1C family serine protease [Chloroflexota bacterium]